MARSKSDKSKGEERKKPAKTTVRKASESTRPARPAVVKPEKPREKTARVKPEAPKRPTVKASTTAKPKAPAKAEATVARKTTEAKKPAPVKAPATPRAEKSMPTKRVAPPRLPKATAASKTPEPPNVEEEASVEPDALSDEERIESAKYLPRDLPPRLFEEERFIFPESYGVNRLRLVPRDPQWLFAHWDVDSRSLGDLRHELGERAAAVSRLTLRISDPDAGGTKVIHVPEGSRSWYVRADTIPRSYRAELGFTLPSGEFRKVAESSTVRTPWSGPSKEKAKGRVRYDQVRDDRIRASASAPEPEPWEDDEAAVVIDPGPWQPEAAPESAGSRSGPARSRDQATELPERGGASDTYRR